jgi:hypothetical protein
VGTLWSTIDAQFAPSLLDPGSQIGQSGSTFVRGPTLKIRRIESATVIGNGEIELDIISPQF